MKTFLSLFFLLFFPALAHACACCGYPAFIDDDPMTSTSSFMQHESLPLPLKLEG